MPPVDGRREAWTAAALFVVLLAVFNANGREIGSYDTRPTALAARELLLRGTLALNHVVGATPEYGRRWGVILAKDGRYRSVYSPVAPVIAAALTWPFWKAGAIDIRAPLAPALMAKAAASTLVALAVTVCYLTARRVLPRRRALLVAIGLGLGTGLWSSASQTLWQSESAILGLSVALYLFASPSPPRWMGTVLAALALALAAAARPQLAPAAGVLMAGMWRRWGGRRVAVAGVVVALTVAPLLYLNWRWFGHPLGPLPLLEQVNSDIHGTGTTFAIRPEPWLGLLVSPSRGLLVFSPVVLLAIAAGRQVWAQRGETLLPACALAIAAQYALYASYSVWWGGHTFGPRYLLDVLPLATPLAAAVLRTTRARSLSAIAASLALVWSVCVAATGAFCYPHDAWNSEPRDIDRDHRRLWSVADNQISRCWHNGPSPQNFSLWTRDSVRRPPDSPALLLKQ